MGFVVEGFNDELKVLSVLKNAYCVVTKGTRMNNRVRMDVDKALEVCDEVFLLTDPDEAGDKLAAMFYEYYPNLKRFELDREQCLCYRNNKLKVGVEHCSNEYLLSVLSQFIKNLC